MATLRNRAAVRQSAVLLALLCSLQQSCHAVAPLQPELQLQLPPQVQCIHGVSVEDTARFCVVKDLVLQPEAVHAAAARETEASDLAVAAQFRLPPDSKGTLIPVPLAHASGNPPGRFELSPLPSAEADAACHEALHTHMAVFMFRDATMMWHLFNNQLRHLYFALRGLDRLEATFTVIYGGGAESWMHTDAFDYIFEAVSGRPLLHLAHLDTNLCAAEAVLGITCPYESLVPEEFNFIDFGVCATEELVQRHRPLYLDFRAWVRQRLGVTDDPVQDQSAPTLPDGLGVPSIEPGAQGIHQQLPDVPPQNQHRKLLPPNGTAQQSLGQHSAARQPGIRLLVIDRKGASRRWLNADEIEAAAVSLGLHVSRHELNGDLATQIQQLQGTDILLGTHGSALTLPMFFAHPRAVVIEVQSYGHSHTGWACGFANMARMTHTSMIVWHNREQANSQPADGDNDLKNSHTRLPVADVEAILHAAVELFETPVEARGERQTVYLNDEAPLPPS